MTREWDFTLCRYEGKELTMNSMWTLLTIIYSGRLEEAKNIFEKEV